MKLLKTSILFFLLIGFSTPTQAQFWKKIKKRLEKKVENKVLDKIDRTADKKIDETLDGKGKKKTKKTTVKNEKSSLKKKEVIPPKPLLSKVNTQTYRFNTSITIEMSGNTSTDKAVFEYFFDKNNQNITCFKVDPSKMGGGNSGMKGEIYMVLNKENPTMFMNMMGMKIKKSVDKNQMNQFDNSTDLDDTEITKTGKSKSILGYSCSEYLVKHKNDDKTTVHIWATTANFPIKGTFIPILGMRNENSKIKGFILEMNVKNAKGSNTIKVTKINKNTSLTINASEYKSFGF